MRFWSAVIQKLKEVIHKMIGAKTIEQTLHVMPTVSSAMEDAIQKWSDMYIGKAPWLKEPSYSDPTRVVSLGLPALISSEKARTALLEFQSEVTTPVEEEEIDNPDYVEPQPDELGNIMPSIQPKTIKQEKPKTDTKRAEFLNEQYKKLKAKLRTQIEYGIAKGGLVIKPYVVKVKTSELEGSKESYSIEWDFCQADSFYPIAFNSSGDITEAAFLQSITRKDSVYRRLEYHKWENNSVTVVNRAFKSTSAPNSQGAQSIDLGLEIPLTEVPEWAGLQPETKVAPVSKPLFGYFKMPEANTIDPCSPLGVSGFSRAVDLIKDADMQYSRLLWEYEGGELAIDIDRNALEFLENPEGGVSMLNNLQKRLYRKVDISTTGDTYNAYAPSLRDANYLQGLNAILMRIEDAVSLSRGTLSDVASEARTATELKIMKQRSYQANADLQQAIQNAIEAAMYGANAFCTLYRITDEGDYEMSFEWDDSILTDVDTELGKRITLMHEGIAGKLETRMWYFGETERQAREALQEIQAENQQAMEDNLMMTANLARE